MTKKLYRNTEEGMIAGVCAGLADYFGVDQAIWRLAMVFATLISGGVFLLVYLVALIIIPKQPVGATRVRDAEYTVHE
jgi:phage shock protein C